MDSIFKSEHGRALLHAHYEAAVKASPIPLESRVVSTSFGDTHLLIGGPVEALPVLLFHGWNGNAAGCTAEFPFLYAHYRVYAPDIIGHSGKSASRRPDPNSPALAHWAAEVLDQLGIAETIVMGISGGGWMTLKFAAYHPARARKIVALSCDGLSALNMVGALLNMVPMALFPNPTTARRFTQFVRAPNLPDSPYVTAFSEFMPLLMAHYVSQRNPGLLTADELQHLTMPTLILMGEYERIFLPTSALTRARKFIPGLAAAELVPNAGHLMVADQPAWLAQRILSFLQPT